MLRERIDIAILEDFVAGLARASGLRAAVYDRAGRLITVSPPRSQFALLADHSLQALPQPLEMTSLAVREPPAAVAFVPDGGVWHVIAPVHLGGQTAGFVSVGDLRDGRSHEPPALPDGHASIEIETWARAWECLPALDRAGDGQPVATVR